MKQNILSLLLLGGIIALSTAEASAVVCAAGVYRAGCVAGGGAAVVRRPVVHPVVAPRRAVVVGYGYYPSYYDYGYGDCWQWVDTLAGPVRTYVCH
jgi:hypothetical protein